MTPLQHEAIAIAAALDLLQDGVGESNIRQALIKANMPLELSRYDTDEINSIAAQICNVGVGALEAYLKGPEEDPTPALTEEELPSLEEIEVDLDSDPNSGSAVVLHGPAPSYECPHEWCTDASGLIDQCLHCGEERA